MVFMRVIGCLLLLVGIMLILTATIIAPNTTPYSLYLGIGIPFIVLGPTVFGLS
jgi:hypothetical protein